MGGGCKRKVGQGILGEIKGKGGDERRGVAKGREVIRKERKVIGKGARDAKEERDGEVNGNSREGRG